MKFVNFVKYRDSDTIAADRPAHFAYADQLRAKGELAIGGPLMDDQGRRIGLLFIYEAISRDAALGLVQKDPFTLANGLSSYELTEWHLRGFNLIYFKTTRLPVRYLIYISMTALGRFLIELVSAERHTGVDILIVTGAILMLSLAVLVLRFGSSHYPSDRTAYRKSREA